MALQNVFARIFSRENSDVAIYFKDLINPAQEILIDNILTVTSSISVDRIFSMEMLFFFSVPSYSRNYI